MERQGQVFLVKRSYPRALWRNRKRRRRVRGRSLVRYRACRDGRSRRRAYVNCLIARVSTQSRRYRRAGLLFAIAGSGKGQNLRVVRQYYKLHIHEMTGQRKIKGSSCTRHTGRRSGLSRLEFGGLAGHEFIERRETRMKAVIRPYLGAGRGWKI